MFERGVQPEKFIELANGLWHKHCDMGSLVPSITAPGIVDLEIRGMPAPHRAHCVTFTGWLEGVFALSPGSRVRVDERSCIASGDPNCEMRVTWGG